MKKYEVEYRGKIFQYEVTFEKGDNYGGIIQTIDVEGFGRKIDTAVYGGPYGHPEESMKPTGRLIALEILRENWSTQY